MWLSPQTTAQIVAHENATQAQRDAQRLIDSTGRGICQFCGEEILKNLEVPGGGWEWETEHLIGYCDQNSTNSKRHKPRVAWTPDEGVVNV